MDRTNSNKIQILSFYSIYMVVVCHAYNLKNSSIENNREFIYYIEYLFSSELGNIVVIPVFFFLSGYLFFYNHDFKVNTFGEKIKKRFKTLLIPYLIWCFLWFMVVYGVQFLPQLSGFFEQPLHEMPLWRQMWLAFVDPINYPFWFIRELIFFVVVTPLIYLGIKYLKFYFLIILAALIFLKQPSLVRLNDVSLFQFLGFLFFSMGAYASINKIKLITNFKPYVYMLLLLLWGITIGVDFYVKDTYSESYWFSVFWKRIAAMTGFFAIWCGYDFLNRKFSFKDKKIYSYKFFIFAAHGIFVAYVTKMYIVYIKESITMLFLLYFIFPFIATVICIYCAKFIEKYIPGVYSVLTGSR